LPDFTRVYARQEYLTPGAAQTVRMIAERVQPDEDTWLLDMGSGKGEAAATLAGEFGCRILAVERNEPFIHYSAAKFWHFNLRDLVTVLRANGRKLPVRDSTIDAAYCIGGPSIVGLERALGELARATRPGGWVICSDICWRSQPGALGKEWDWLATVQQTTAGEYQELLKAAGLTVEDVYTHPREDWEEYFRPMLAVADEAKTTQPADVFLADEIESQVALERRAADAYLDYVTFVARR
jgi:ubiquinone/menaquinone biosynthesis C-methylase UbiE